ncbi:MAG: GTP-binding protein [Selenomonadaceae bacterium]|nr:GTP-binding protein [Selenomonadaceae bacterium]
MSELKIVFVGHVDHGKSTIIGRLLFDTKSLPQGVVDKVQRIADETGKNFEFAYLLDAFAEERQQGITIDTTQLKFSTATRDYLIIDAPGHKEFLKNMISGAANANAAFLVIDAAAGVREQSRRHAYLLSLLGIKKIFVLVNKMDLVGYSEQRFREVAEDIKNFLATINVTPQEIIPISGFVGDNVTARSKNFSWYAGDTLIDTLDKISGIDENVDAALRLPIQDVYKFDERRIIVGRIESGRLNVGDKVQIFPDGRETVVTAFAHWQARDKKISAKAGESVGIIVADEFFNKRGEIITLANDTPLKVSSKLRASVFWLGKNFLTVGKTYKLKLATAEVEATVEKIIRTVDAATLERRENSSALKLNDVGEIVFKLKDKLAFDEFGFFQATGRFVLVDGFDVAGGGIVLSAENSQSNGTTFVDGNLTLHAELFDEFYYDVEQRKITQVAESKNENYRVGDTIQTTGFSYEYPTDFDIIFLNAGGFVKIRGTKIISIGRLENYAFEKVPLVNSRGFGIKVNNAESFDSFLREFAAIENSRALANFSNKYFFLNQFRELKFYFDYVI